MRAPVVRGLIALACALGHGCERPRPPPAVLPPPPAAPAPAVAPAEPATLGAVVASAAGSAERLHDSAWSPLSAGDRVQAEDSLRTGPSGTAELEIGARARITVAPNTQVHVAELTEAVHRLRLQRGRVFAAYEADGQRVLRIEGEDGGAVAEARTARFSALATPGGFAVSAETGSVHLRAAGSSVEVATGQQSVARAGKAPTPAAALSPTLLLKVAAAGRRGAPCAELRGAATPGAEILIDGESAPVDEAGRFRAAPLVGRREVEVVARDASGRFARRKVLCPAPASPADARIQEMKIRWRE